jgi:hypothetical protein
MADPAKMEQEIEAALRTGDMEGAARVYMAHKSCSLDDARKEIHRRLLERRK